MGEGVTMPGCAANEMGRGGSPRNPAPGRGEIRPLDYAPVGFLPSVRGPSGMTSAGGVSKLPLSTELQPMIGFGLPQFLVRASPALAQ